VAELEPGKGDGLAEFTGDADAAGRVRAVVGDGGRDGRGYGLAALDVAARGEVAVPAALASISFLSRSRFASCSRCILSRSARRCLSLSLVSASEAIAL
jgi:hypothetical protein